jgi:hypothetical protein
MSPKTRDAFEILKSDVTPVAPKPRRRIIPVVTTLTIVLLAVLAVGGWAMYLRQSPLAISLPSQGPSESPLPSAPAFGDSGSRAGLPKPDLTPGERGPEPMAAAPVPDSVRERVFAAYGLDPAVHRHVAVRLIPAELGGTNGVRNVFPVTPWFAALKARLDGFLVEQVRRGRMTPIQAESQLTANWVKACHVHYIRNYGSSDPEEARKTEDQLRWER